MFETAMAQLRLAVSLVLGVPFDLKGLDRLVDALRETRREFGPLPSVDPELLGGPSLDEEDRRTIQLRRFRQQARRAARETTYYAALFGRLGLDPARLSHDDIARLPLTPKAAIRDDPDGFVRASAQVALRTTTTGTTGRPTSVAFSAYELQVSMALGAIQLLTDGRIGHEDIVQLNTSSRASLGNVCFAGACARVGGLVSPVGLVDPELALGLLAEPRRLAGKKPKVSVLLTYPSYLGQLTESGLGRGYRPSDFGLERIAVGGEIVTAGLKARCQRLFGPVQFDEGYGMTEIWGMGGRRCPEGHLHFEPIRGLLEVLDPDTGLASRPGEVGTIVATPFPPFQDATVVLRYDTEDLVHTLSGSAACGLASLPATTDLLGKRRLAVRHDGGWVLPRDVLEALEALDDVPLPVRCGVVAALGGGVVEAGVRRATPAAHPAIEQALEARGVPLRGLRLVGDPSQLTHPLPLRGDLRESSFGPLPATDTPRVAGVPDQAMSAAVVDGISP
jgi:phenylacetate-coenzyme A ligase PaaK-like adenylate-forming protein